MHSPSLVTPSDFEEIKRIHYNHFKDEFTLDDFMDPHTLRAWSIRNDDGKIICVGGIRAIVEAVMITDKEFPADERRDAFYKMLEAMMFICRDYGFNQLHAFIQDEKWLRHLKSAKFHETKGRSLVLNI